MTLPTAPTGQPAAPTSGTSTPPALDLTYVQAMPPVQPTTPTQTPGLPGAVLTPLNQVWAHLQAAQTAFNALSGQHKTIWENAAQPVEYRRTLTAQLLSQTFATVDTELTAAESSLTAAKNAVKVGLTPPLLGAADVHELKLMNAREEVRTALEGLQPYDQVPNPQGTV